MFGGQWVQIDLPGEKGLNLACHMRKLTCPCMRSSFLFKHVMSLVFVVFLTFPVKRCSLFGHLTHSYSSGKQEKLLFLLSCFAIMMLLHNDKRPFDSSFSQWRCIQLWLYDEKTMTLLHVMFLVFSVIHFSSAWSLSRFCKVNCILKSFMFKF